MIMNEDLIDYEIYNAKKFSSLMLNHYKESSTNFQKSNSKMKIS